MVQGRQNLMFYSADVLNFEVNPWEVRRIHKKGHLKVHMSRLIKDPPPLKCSSNLWFSTTLTNHPHPAQTEILMSSGLAPNLAKLQLL